LTVRQQGRVSFAGIWFGLDGLPKEYTLKLEKLMQGVQYVTDEQGEKTGVLIDLKKNGELWEDFYDVALLSKRKNEPREALESVKKRVANFSKR
jgi:hypothetical protein